MNCPKCNSSNTRKNGTSRGKQRWKCLDCGRTSTENPDLKRGGGRRPRKWENDAERLRAYRKRKKLQQDQES